MSAKHVGWAFEQSVGSPTQKLVLVALADRINKDTLICRPLIKNLAADCCLSERSVQRALNELCAAGTIERERRRRKDGSLSGYDYRFPDLSSPPDTVSPSPPDTVSGQEPEENLEPVVLAAAPQNGRPRNEIWDALTVMFGEPSTRSNQTKRGKVMRELKEAGATPDEILARGKRWPLHFENATLTETALVTHWDRLGRKPLRAGGRS